MRKRLRFALAGVIAIVALQLFLISPLGIGGNAASHLPEFLSDDGAWAIIRSIALGCLASLLTVSLGFGIAVFLCDLRSPIVGQILAVCTFSAMLGDAMVGFIFMRVPMHFVALQNRVWATTLGLTALIEIWQHLPLYVFLFWYRLQVIPDNVSNFLGATSLGFRETVQHVLWPHCRPLAMLLALYGFTCGYQEFAKTEIIFRSSPAHRTESVNNFLARVHNNRQITYSKALADRVVLAYSAISTIPSIVVAPLCVFIFVWVRGLSVLRRRIAKAVLRLGPPARITDDRIDRLRLGAALGRNTKPLRVTGLSLLVVATFVPFVLVVPDSTYQLNVITALNAIALTVLAAGATVFTAAAFAFAARTAFPDVAGGFSNRSLPLFLGVFALRLVPAGAVGVCAYWWLGRTLNPSLVVALTLWALSQVLLALPLIAAFILLLQFDIPTAELHFQEVHSSTEWEVAWLSFLRRLGSGYLFAGLFAASLVWNESVVTGIFSYEVPSVTMELVESLKSHRGAGYGPVAGTVLLSGVLAGGGAWLWIRRVSRRIEGARLNG